MGAMVVLTGGRVTGKRMLIVGLLLGVAACVSLKTSLLVATLLLAGGITWLFTKPEGKARVVWAAVAGFVIAPAAIILLFVHLGAWHDLVYCNFTFNELLTKTRPHAWIFRALWLPWLVLIAWGARQRAARTDNRWRFFLGLACLMFTITLAGFWILISARDFLPILPFFAMAGAQWADRRRFRAEILIGWTALCLYGHGHYTDWLANETREFTTMMNQVLGLTRPGEYLMDYKGETIYRRRPYYYIFEMIGRSQMRAGLIPDTIPEDMIRTRCHVMQADGRFWPPRAKRFLLDYTIDLGRLRASGNWIGENGAFRVAIPAMYAILDKRGNASGVLDGVPYTGPRMLAAGMHTFLRAKAERVVWLWAPAYARGYSPFHLRDTEF
jgi:hypothetical protein